MKERSGIPVRYGGLVVPPSPEKVAVCASTLESKAVASDGVDQDPIRLNVAISGPVPLAREGIIAMAWLKRRPRRQFGDHFLVGSFISFCLRQVIFSHGGEYLYSH